MMTTIPNAPDYAIAESGFVYNVKTKRRMKRQWISGCWRSHIRDANGKSFYLCHDRIPTSQNHDVLAQEQLKPIPDFQRYAVTPYGAVWCVTPAIYGPHAGKPYIVSEHFRSKRRYVKLTDKFGKQKNVSLARIMEQVYGQKLNT
jgi:hypothetical protein